MTALLLLAALVICGVVILRFSAELNAFADVQSAAVSSWGYVVCTDSRGKVREAGWDVDGTRDTRDWPRLLVR